MTTNSVNISPEYLTVLVLFSFLVVSIFLFIITVIYFNVVNDPQRLEVTLGHQKSKTLLKLAMCIWITIIIYQITDNLLLNGSLIPMISQCTDGSCNYCSVIGQIKRFLMAFRVALILVFLIKSLKYYSSLHPCYLVFLKILIFILFAMFTLRSFLVKFHVKALKHNPGWMLCVAELPEDATEGLQVIFYMQYLVVLILVIITISFSRAIYLKIVSIKFYQYSFSESPDHIIEYERKVSLLIKYGIICVQIFIINSTLNWLAWKIFMNDLSFNTNPITQLMDGMCVFMLFEFGQDVYYFFYGCIHARILKQWQKRHKVAIEVMLREAELTEDSYRRARIKKKIRRSSTHSWTLSPVPQDQQLDSIHEESSDDYEDLPIPIEIQDEIVVIPGKISSLGHMPPEFKLDAIDEDIEKIVS